MEIYDGYVEHNESDLRHDSIAIKSALGELALNNKSFVVIGGASLVLRGVLRETPDLDLLANEDAVESLRERDNATYELPPGYAFANGATNMSVHLTTNNGLPVSATTYMNGMGIHPLEFSRIYKSRNLVMGHPCISLREIILSKQALRRPKDTEHLLAIKSKYPDMAIEVPAPSDNPSRGYY